MNNSIIRILGVGCLLVLTALLSVPMSLLLGAVCFGLRQREPWVLSDSLGLSRPV